MLLDLVELDFDLPDLLRACLVGRKDRGRVLSLTLGARDLVAGGVLLALQALELGNQTTTPELQRRKLFQLGVQTQTAVLQSVTDLLDVISTYVGSIMRCLSCVPAFSDQRSGRP